MHSQHSSNQGSHSIKPHAFPHLSDGYAQVHLFTRTLFACFSSSQKSVTDGGPKAVHVPAELPEGLPSPPHCAPPQSPVGYVLRRSAAGPRLPSDFSDFCQSPRKAGICRAPKFCSSYGPPFISFPKSQYFSGCSPENTGCPHPFYLPHPVFLPPHDMGWPLFYSKKLLCVLRASQI